MELTAEPCSPVRVDHAEGPFWYGDRFGWVDIMAGRLWISGFDGAALTDPRSYDVGRPLGAAVPREGGWVLAAGTAFYRLDEDGTVTPLTEDLADPSVVRMNDGKCDPAGRFWAGTMDYGESRPIASLYVHDGTKVRTVLDGVAISNGLTWSLDRRTMYYIDTPTGRVDAFDYDEYSGEISGRRPFASVEGGHPDGMTIDDEGFLWVALWGGGAVRRLDPSGRVAGTVHLPVTNVSSCCFGGPGGTTLFITTSQKGLSPERLKSEPDAGRIFRVEPGVTGQPSTRFG